MLSAPETIREIAVYKKKLIISNNKYFTAAMFYNYRERVYVQEFSI